MQGGMMKKFYAVLAAAVVLAGVAVGAWASSCTGMKVSNECIPAENILDGTLGASVSGSGCGATNLPQGVSITYGLTVGSATVNDTSALSVVTAGGITAGTPGVAIVNVSGKIPAISSSYFASLSGANLTGIVTAGLASSAVTSDKIGSLAVTNGKLGAASITSDKLSSSAVTSGKLLCAKADGGIGYCSADVTSQNCTCN